MWGFKFFPFKLFKSLIKNVAQEKERTCTKKEKMSEKKEDRKKGEGREGVKFRMRSVEGAGARTGTYLTIAAIALALALCVCAFAQWASAAQVSVMPAYQEVRTGENFTVSIYVDPEGSEVYGAHIYALYFDNILLKALNLTKGPFLGDDTWVVYSEINNSFNSTHGRIKYGETRWNVPTGVTEPGVLANIIFQAIAEENGVSELHFGRVVLSDPNGAEIKNVSINHGNVSVRVGICGDVNSDDKIRTNDVTTLLDYVGKIPGVTINEWAGDVNCDGKWRTNDVTQLLDYVGKVPGASLNCC